MGLVIFNASLYLIALLLYYRIIRKVVDLGFILIALYSFVAVVGIFYYQTNPSFWKLSIAPFVFLFTISILSFRPFFIYRSGEMYDKLIVRKPYLLRYYSFFFIICTLLSFFFSYSKLMGYIESGNWYEIYNAHWDKSFKIWDNQLDRVVKWVTGFTSPLAIISFYYFLTAKDKKKFLSILLITALVINSFITAIFNGTRGTIVIEVFKIIMCYFVFAKQITKKTKKTLFITGICIIALVLVYSMAVTISRFESQENNTFLLYFGESMLVFNYGLVDSINSFLYGDYFWGTLDLANINNILHTHFGPSFFTFVGAWYIDFGPIGTFLLALFLPMLLFGGWKKKKKIDIADLLIYLTWLIFLVNGVFVIGAGYYFFWLFPLILFVFLKIIKI